MAYGHKSATKNRINVLRKNARRKLMDSIIKSDSEDNLEARFAEQLTDVAKENLLEIRITVDLHDSLLITEPKVTKKSSAPNKKLMRYIDNYMLHYLSRDASLGAWLVTFCIWIKYCLYRHMSHMGTALRGGLTFDRMTLRFATEIYFNDERMDKFL